MTGPTRDARGRFVRRARPDAAATAEPGPAAPTQPSLPPRARTDAAATAEPGPAAPNGAVTAEPSPVAAIPPSLPSLPRTDATATAEPGPVAPTPPSLPRPDAAVTAEPGPAAPTPPSLPPLPGLAVVGMGIHLRPYQPYTLAQLLFPRDTTRTITSRETRTTYIIPDGYEINDSPPFPANEALHQVIVEESWDRFEGRFAFAADAPLGNASFSISATADRNDQSRAEQAAYYAARSSFVPLWMAYIANPNDCVEALRNPDISAPFAPEHRHEYEDFFRRYGSHYVRGAWIGGKSTLIFTVLKSSNLSREDIHAGIKASLRGVGGEHDQEQIKEQLRIHSQCTVIGRGGDEALLAAMTSLDRTSYHQWLKTIPHNPQVLELDVAGIWTLIRDPAKATALSTAYRESVSFVPIRAVFDIGRDLYVVRGDRVVRHERDSKITHLPRPLHEVLPGLADDSDGRIDEAFRGRHLVSSAGQRLDDKLYVFRRDRVIRVDIVTRLVDPGYPMQLADAFPGLPFDRIDAALVTAADSIYFFYGNRYARFDPTKSRVDDGYPQPIARRWLGVTFDRLDAAVATGDGKVYFIKGDQHIRYDLTRYCADPGYPKYVIGNYVEDLTFIDECPANGSHFVQEAGEE